MDDTKHERRRDARLLCADLIEVIWCEANEEKRKVANLEDISERGMSLQMEYPIHVGSNVRVKYGHIELSGLIRYAVYRNNAYFVGLQFDETSRWSARHFIPDHLFDPRRLSQRMRIPSEPAPRWVN